MTNILNRIAPTIWTRLFLLILTTVFLTWVVVGVAFFWFGTAQSVVEGLGSRQVPKLMNATRLSSHAAELAMLSNRILSAQKPDPEGQETALRASIADLEALLKSEGGDGFGTDVSQRLQSNLTGVIRALDETRTIEVDLLAQAERLRWLNVDFQDEITAFKADTTYNIETMMLALKQEPDDARRLRLIDTLQQEQRNGEMFADLGDAMSVATTLGIQSAASQTPEQLEQFEALLADAHLRAGRWQSTLRDSTETVSLVQGLETLERNALSKTGIIEKRRDWFRTRERLRTLLDASFTILNDVQVQIRDLTEHQRADLIAVSNAFSERSAATARVLLLLTLFGAVAGVSILFLYVRPSIIRPMQVLTKHMRQIAAGERVMLDDPPARNDEIAELSRAVLAFQTSVSERDDAIRRLRQTQSELVQAGKIAALGSLSAGISHELNQPLGAIRQRLRLSEKALAAHDTDAAARQIGKIDDLVSRIEKIIDHLRRFARRSDYTKEPVELAPLLTEVGELLRSKLDSCDATLIVEPEVAKVVFLGDSVLTSQVMVNLISNAADAIAETGAKGEIRVRVEEAPPGKVAFSVVDTGAGFGALSPDRAVDPFVTTKEPGDGMGLGLSISLNILTGMGGGLTLARRANGPGARATITLPEGQA